MNITLKKNGWYIKLNTFIFGEEIRFPSLCPQFWLTIFCIVAFPFVASFKTIKWLFKATILPISNLMSKAIDKWLCSPIYDSYVMHSSIDVLTNGYKIYNTYPKERRECLNGWDLEKTSFKEYSIFLKWKEKIGNGYEEYLNKLIAQELVEKQKRHELEVAWLLKRQEKQAKIQEIKKTPLIQNIIHYTSAIGKTIFWLVSSFLVLFILFILYKFGVWMVHFYNTHWFNWKFFYVLLSVLSLSLIFALLAALLSLIIKKISNCTPITDVFTKIGNRILFLLVGIAYIFVFIWKGMKILFILIKENYCPIIEWKE